MASTNTSEHLSLVVAENLPFLRRYARALTGSQTTGDRYAAATLEALLVDRSVFDLGLDPKTALFLAFHKIWESSSIQTGSEVSQIARKTQDRLAALTPNTREVLLLRTLENFSLSEVAQILETAPEDVAELHKIALREMEDNLSGKVMIIEDEAIIALDLQTIVADMGHKITGVARTESEAVRLFDAERPDLIMSDIQLADGSSGIVAVNQILITAGDTPVIFITAFPERLLTGDRPEPAFVITKPYTEEQVASAVSQAMFFASTETLFA